MNLYNAKCPFCGEIIKVDKRDEATICSNCKKPFITIKAIQMHNQTLNEDSITINKNENLERMLQKAAFFQKIGEQQKAREIYEKVTDEYPEDYRGWLNLVGKGNKHAIDILYKICNPMPTKIKEEISKRMIKDIESEYTFENFKNTIAIPVRLWESDVKYCPCFFQSGYNRAKEFINKYSEKKQLDILKRSMLETASNMFINIDGDITGLGKSYIKNQNIVCIGKEYSKYYLPNLIDGLLFWRLISDFSYNVWDEHISLKSNYVIVTKLGTIEQRTKWWGTIRERKLSGTCIYCGGTFSIFSGKCKRCGRRNPEGIY